MEIDAVYEAGTLYLNERDELFILDQTLLPGERQYIPIKTAQAVWQAIYQLKVRGAPAIGVAAAYGLYVASKNIEENDADKFCDKVYEMSAYLAGARPTAVNLTWALERMEGALNRARTAGAPPQALRQALKEEALAIHREDRQVCFSIAQNGLTLLKKGMGLLTHCNAGALATTGCGTALAPIYLGQSRGYGFRVFADETRPLLQGARLTAYELTDAGVDVTVICDNMAASVMAQGWVDAVLVGCDRVAANGDVANKIGTLSVALAAKHYGIPFYVCAPTSTLDPACPDGAQIPIEQREGVEIAQMWYQAPMVAEGAKTYNPAFDVTGHELITALITEKGVLYPPFDRAIAAVLRP